MSAVARVRAQAKVNLFLRILAREQSGYHSIETLFLRVGLADTITIRPTSGRRALDCASAHVGPVEANLAWRAATAYAAATGWPAGFEITLEKAIPVGGGLGGGSADAGAVLRALNALAPRPLAHAALLEIAGALGSDVPFMALDTPLALAWGRGDRVLSLPPLPVVPIELVIFDFGVSSAAAYGWVAQSRRGTELRVPSAFFGLDALATWDGIAGLATNDFEPEVGGRHPEIARCLASAREAGAWMAQLSGSGASVFAIPRPGSEIQFGALPPGATVVRTTTADSVEDVVVTR